MNSLSLRARTLGTALIVLLVFVPLLALTLERAFCQSLLDATHEQLRLQNLGLISEFDLSDGVINMPQQLFNDALNLPDSGTVAFIAMHMLPAWQSSSAAGWAEPPTLNLPPVGGEMFQRVSLPAGDYFQFSYTASFEDQNMLFPVTFHILKNAQLFDTQLAEFRTRLWSWLGVIVALLIIVLLASLGAALRPVARLTEQVGEIEQGERKRLVGHYPPELETLKTNLNQLLDSQQHQRSRYRNSLSDLAHALKTPLAVLSGTDNLPDAAKAPIEQIKQQINRQLKRAVASRDAILHEGFAVADSCNKLVNAMDKVHANKQLSLHLDVDEDARFFGDLTDFSELLGNLLDNACKAASQQVQLTVKNQHGLLVQVEDDGPGIGEEQREWLLQRGVRLDTYQEGHGIGMAIVNDLVLAYGGELSIGTSRWQGACFTLKFNHPQG